MLGTPVGGRLLQPPEGHHEGLLRQLHSRAGYHFAPGDGPRGAGARGETKGEHPRRFADRVDAAKVIGGTYPRELLPHGEIPLGDGDNLSRGYPAGGYRSLVVDDGAGYGDRGPEALEVIWS